jgi:phenylacetate-CoA ligase
VQGYYIQKTRFNSDFKRELERYRKSNPEKINESELKEFLTIASESKFWQEKFSIYNLNLEAEDLLLELKKLPILTKKEVQENLDIIKVDKLNDTIKTVNTSGTTGAGLVFQQTQSMENQQWAIWWRYRNNHGIQCNTWMGWFGGRSVMDVDVKKPPYWRINYPGKQVLFSAHHLSKSTVICYHTQIVKRDLKWLHGYPSQLAYFASLIKENDLSNIKMEFVTTGAENLLTNQIEIIKEVFGVEPIQHYGLAEGVANISQLPSGKFQLDQDFAYTELVPSGFDENVYKIIGTNYSNIAFPLIRYDTNDLVRVYKKNNKLEIISIDGRNEDFVTLPSGVKLGRLDHIFKKATFIQEAQIYQPNINTIIVRIVKGNHFEKSIHEKQVLKECILRFGDEVVVKIEYINKIAKTKSGKLRFVISDLK